jgi:(R,R)-butanediol dehydrogenase/meso-butanediol dehydrogenase/diacetyl reductase
MRAAVYHGPGDVRIESVPAPGAPGPGELVLEVLRGAICGTDSSEYAHGPHLIPLHERHPNSGHVGPLVLGHEFVGRVTAVGEGVSDFAVGDRVVTGAGVSCGDCDWCLAGRTNLCAHYYTLGLHTDGGLATAAKTPASICVAVPEDCTDDAAAMAQPLAVALHGLNRARVSPAETVVIIGVGGIGALMVGGAGGRGLEHVVAVDVDEGRLATARALGAAHTVDATREDPVQAIRELTGGSGAHAVIEASGAPASPGQALQMVRRGGRVVIVGLQSAPVPLDLFDVAMREVEITSALAHVCADDLPVALEILTRTDLADNILDRVIPLDRLVDDGLRVLAERRAAGKILVDPTSKETDGG